MLIKKLRTCLVSKGLEDRVHCFSMQVVLNKRFFLIPGKKLAQIRLVVFEKNAPLKFEKMHL